MVARLVRVPSRIPGAAGAVLRWKLILSSWGRGFFTFAKTGTPHAGAPVGVFALDGPGGNVSGCPCRLNKGQQRSLLPHGLTPEARPVLCTRLWGRAGGPSPCDCLRCASDRCA